MDAARRRMRDRVDIHTTRIRDSNDIQDRIDILLGDLYP